VYVVMRVMRVRAVCGKRNVGMCMRACDARNACNARNACVGNGAWVMVRG